MDISLESNSEGNRIHRGIQALIHRGQYYYIYEEYFSASELFFAATSLAIKNNQNMLAGTAGLLFEDSSINLFSANFSYFSMAELGTEVRKTISEFVEPQYISAGLFILNLIKSAPKRNRANDPLIQHYKLQYLVLEDVYSEIKNKIKKTNFGAWKNWGFSRVTINDLKDPSRQVDFELRFRDYLRGLKLSGLWKRTFQEISENHHYELLGKKRETIILPEPKNKNEIGLRILLGSNEEHLMIGIAIKDNPHILFKLETKSIDIFSLHRMFLVKPIEEFTKFQEKDEYVLTILKMLWSFTFGAKIIDVIDENGTSIDNCSYINSTFHQFLQKKKIASIKIIPQSIFFGLPLNGAAFICNNKMRFAIEYYSIIYCPPWKIKNEHNEGIIEHSFLVSSKGINLPDLPFSSLECNMCKKFCKKNYLILDSNSEEFYNINKSEIKQLTFNEKLKYTFEHSKKISIISHGELGFSTESNFITLNNGKESIKIDFKYIANLQLAKSSKIFLNCCYSTSASQGTEFEDYNLSLSLLSKGAKYVICNTLPINDFDGFRINTRINELESEGNNIKEAFRATILESIYKTLPFYEECFNDRFLAKETRLRKHRQDKQLITWYPYILWENL